MSEITRPLRSIHKGLNEDNRTGFHNLEVINQVDRQVTGGNDAPPPVNLPNIRQIVRRRVGGNGNTNIDIDQTINIDNSVHHSGLADGLAFFAAHWKEFAIVAGAAAAIAAIAALIKALNKSIKIRYNKVVRTLQRAQKDFTLSEDGLNMKSVLPGVGSGIFDWVARFWTRNFKSKKHTTGNIGLYPFCNQYIDEIANDFRCAQDAFSKIKLAADEEKENGGKSTEGEDDDTEKKMVGDAETKRVEGKHESFGGERRYNSFTEAFRDDLLNEGISSDKLNESVLAAISAGVGLASFAVKGGAWVVSKMKNGKPVEGTEKTVNVTKESTREICYAIINNYADKYVNMKRVFEELGISTDSLADLDMSSCDKLQEILKKYAKPEKNAYTKQYGRIKKAYDNMLKHYYAIGDGIIANFVKYSEAKDEKHSNIIVASKEKLQNMWDSQKDFYDNNFSHIIIEITASDAYIGYLNFIIEKVIPVFKTGLAGQADYVLDVMPKKDEYYLLRQTQDQAWLESGEENHGKTAIAQVISFDEKTKNIKFKLVGLVNCDYSIGADGFATLDDDRDIEFGAYKDQKITEDEGLPYGKWMSLDPIILSWEPDFASSPYLREKEVGDKTVNCYLYATGTIADGGDYNKIIYAEILVDDSNKVMRKVTIDLGFKLNAEELADLVSRKDDDPKKNMEFVSAWVDDSVFARIERSKGEDENADSEDKIVEIVNTETKTDKEEEKSTEAKSESLLYVKETDGEDGKMNKEYIFAEVLKDLESVNHKNDLTLNEEGEDEEKNKDSEENNAETNGDDKGEENDSENDDKGEEKEDNADEKKSEVVEPGTDEAKNENINAILYCNVPDGVEFTDGEKIKGAIIRLEKACSIEDFDRIVTDMGFAKSDDNAEKIKENVSFVLLAKGEDANIKKDSVNDLQATIEEINKGSEENGNNDEIDEKDVDETAQKIIEKSNSINIEDDFRKIKTAKGFAAQIFGSYCYAPNGNLGEKGKLMDILIDDKDGNQKPVRVYPILVRKDLNTPIDSDKLADTAEMRLLLFASTDYHQTAKNDEADIKEKVKNIMIELKTGEKVDDEGYKYLEDSSNAEKSNNGNAGTNDDYKQKIAADVQTLSEMIERKEIDSSNGIKKITFAKKDPNASNSNGNVELVTEKNGVFTIAFKDIPFGNDYFEFNYGHEINGDKAIIFNNTIGRIPVEDGKLAEMLTMAYEKFVLKKDDGAKESISVAYSVNSVVNEGYTKEISLHQEFSDSLPRRWFIVTEGVFDDGNTASSVLESDRFINKLNSRDDVNKYLKSTTNASMKVFERSSDIRFSSPKNYVPSGYTPLYESTLLLKFDKDGEVIDKKRLPVQKITESSK